MIFDLATFWERCLDIGNFMVDQFARLGDDFMIKSIGDFYYRYIGIGSELVDRILSALGLESLTMVGLLFGIFGLYICYQFATWVFNIIT